MKKSYLLSAMVSLLLSTTLFAQWTVNMSPVVGFFRINTVHFLDENTGFVGGADALFSANGLVAKTTNGGATWTTVLNAPGLPVWDIFFITPSIGYAVGESGNISKTTDGGNNWTSAIWGSMSTEALRSVHFIDQNNGWAAGGFYDQELLKTTDGGTTWVKDSLTSLSTFQRLNCVFFTDVNNGFTVGGSGFGGGIGRIYYTNDGGTSWDTVAAGIPAYYNVVYFIDANTGFIGGSNGTLLKTTDGGTTWIQQVNNDPDSSSVSDITFLDANTGWACTIGGQILKTVDGGATWDVNGDVETVISSLYGISVPSATVGFTAGLGGVYAEMGTAPPPAAINTIDQGEGNVMLFPNPATDQVHIKLSSEASSTVTVEVYSMLGGLVYAEMLDSHDIRLNTSKYDAGLYLVKVVGEHKISTGRMVVR